MSAETDLDPQELKYLALQSSRAQRPDQALNYLKLAIRQAPEDGELHYLLGAEHAQLGMYDRAAEEMAHALTLAPGMHTARLQLGLLYLTQAQVAASTETLAPLTVLPENDCFRYFAIGLLDLAHDRFPECRVALGRGIALNILNEPLNADMRKIIDALPPPDAETKPSQAGPEENVWLSAYRQNDMPN